MYLYIIGVQGILFYRSEEYEMKSGRSKRFLIVLFAILFVLMEPAAMFIGLIGTGKDGYAAFADVGSIADGEDITYDKNGGLLSALGFDTSKMPADYDPDATTNPYGSDVSTKNEVKEQVLFERNDTGVLGSSLYGHNKPLDGSLDTFKKDPVQNSASFINKPAFMSSVKCDLNGDGRDSAVAMVYTYYDHSLLADDDEENDPDCKIYMCVYDPKSGSKSSPFEIATLGSGRLITDYMVQSQLQITAGDYNKDSVDEIAVYAPSDSVTGRNKVTFFELIEGTDCQNPFDKTKWRQSWNYVLPLSNESVINTRVGVRPLYTSNIYNNLDLASGDADNDGVCDLIISYGASDTNYLFNDILLREAKIKRSVASRSVLLYGSGSGQMLRKSQEISYGGDDLIRVSFAFGDIDGDGNEDMFIGGQEQSDQDDNVSRVIGKYVYDGENGGMELESLQSMKVVNGTVNDGEFISSNGWDGAYHSLPLMKANLAIGKVMGDDSDTRIYLDSVLYSYDDGNYAIEDELEDATTYDDDKGNTVYRGSHLFADMRGYDGAAIVQSFYYEYGADAGNFTGSVADNITTELVSVRKSLAGFDFTTSDVEARSELIYLKLDKKKAPIGLDKYEKTYTYKNECSAPPFSICAADTDKDSLVAIYTGEHNIKYQDPDVLAVLASAPYFKDVAAYDNGDMLNWCSTAFGETDGETNGYTNTYTGNLGIFFNSMIGTKTVKGVVNLATGYSRSETWGWDRERDFSVSYTTAGGEDAVVMYSVPTENYTYKVYGVTVDDDGNLKEFTQTMVIAREHQPVTQTLTLEDYMEIQKQQSDKLPDVSKYLTSTPGYPASYPKSENDLTDTITDHIPKSDSILMDVDSDYHGDNHPTDVGNKWFGVSYGSGTETQSISYNKSTSDRYKNHMDGAYGTIEAGIGTEEDFLIFHSAQIGLHYDWNRTGGNTNSSIQGREYSGTVSNMPRSAKGYGYDFSWKLFKYIISDKDCTFPVVTYIVNDVSQPPELPDNITQNFDKTTDSQIALSWTYNQGNPLGFDIYRYEDFPQGGGDKLVGTVGGSSYRILKDENGNTMKDKNGHIIRQYEFLDTDLTADTKYSYRMKARTAKLPGESIFSPVIEARTDVSTKPDLSLSADDLTIYPDSTYDIKVNLADPEHYQKDISYQWQKYNAKKRVWEDLDGRDKQKLHFYNCNNDDKGEYRCRVNLIRKVESNPQYISAFTESCTVDYSLRHVKFSNLMTFEGSGEAPVNTGVTVTVTKASEACPVKPSGGVTFKIKGPNGTVEVKTSIDEKTGIARINSIEDMIGTLGQQDFVDGGYLISVEYEGNDLFYAADCPEEYHYLRNIDECMFLSVRSSYYFGDDIAPDVEVFDYKKSGAGKITRTDLTDRLSTIKFYAANDDGQKTGDPVETYVLSETDGKAPVPFSASLVKKAYVEAYLEGETEPAAGSMIETVKIPVEFDVQERMTGTGSMLELMSSKDVRLSTGADPDEKNIHVGDEKKSLTDYMLFKYYEQNGDFMYDSTEAPDHKDDFVPASYNVKVELTGDEVERYYDPAYRGGELLVVGNYYYVSAGPRDSNSGMVQMLSPDNWIDFTKKGYPGGTQIVLKAIPNRGYEISKWIVDDCGTGVKTLPGTEKLTYTIRSQATEGNGEVKFKAIMVPKDNTLTYRALGKGSITAEPELESGSTVLADARISFTGKPDKGWHFSEWRWSNEGGSDTVTTGVIGDDGSSSKTFIMPDNPVELTAVFMKDGIDITTTNDFIVSYKNEDSNPYYENGAEVETEKGKGVPEESEVTVRTKPGITLAPGAEWSVNITTPEGIYPVEVEEVMVGGREACRFRLPAGAQTCIVSADTIRGRFSVDASADDVEFTIKVDGVEMNGSQADDIDCGAQVDIQAKPARGKLLKNWIINGETAQSDDNNYSINITENLTISAETKEDTELTINLTASGGKGKYTITDKNGDTHEKTFEGADNKVDVYKGESIAFTNADDDLHTLTSVFVDGVKQDSQEGSFTIPSVSADMDVECRYAPNTYHKVKITKSVRRWDPLLQDEDGAEIYDGDVIKVENGSDIKFSMTVYESIFQSVLVDGEVIEPYNHEQIEDMTRYDYKIENISKDLDVIASDHRMRIISTAEDMVNYIQSLHDNITSSSQYDGVLMNDIDMSGTTVTATPGDCYAIFEGNGHTISGLTVGTEESKIYDFHGIFGTLRETGEINDLVLKDVTVRVQGAQDGYCGMLTFNNFGKIQNVAVINGDFHVDQTELTLGTYESAGITVDNHGLIQNCMVRGFNLEATDRYYYQIGSAGVVYNEEYDGNGDGVMKNNYFEGFRVKGYGDGYYTDAEQSIVAKDNTDKHLAQFESNYFKAPYGKNDSHGISVYTLCDDPDDQTSAEAEAATPEFARKVAYKMNEDAGADVWGLTDNDSKEILQIRLGGEKVTAPIRITYITEDKTVKQYMLPGPVKLPGSDVFGDKTPAAWVLGDNAYAPGYVVNITENADLTGIASTEDYKARLSGVNDSGELINSTYYNSVDEAVKDAMDHEQIIGPQVLDILGEAEIKSPDVVFDDTTTFKVAGGAKLTLGRNSQIINNGTMIAEAGAEVHKYGSIDNKGTLTIIEGSSFYNYGSVLKNTGILTGKENIICQPHVLGEWTYSDEPDDQGRWIKSCTCQVCGENITEEVEPDPPVSKVDSIKITHEPDLTAFEIGQEFSDSGLKVAAKLTDGTGAPIKTYDLILTIGDDYEKEIKNGDVLDKSGTGKVTVKYERFTCSYDITIVDLANIITVTDADGKEITKAEMESGSVLTLNASLKARIPYKTAFNWSIDDRAVAELGKYGAADTNTVTAKDPGTAEITVTLVDDKGNPVNGVEPKKVAIENVSHVTDISILGGDISINKGDTYEIQAKITPDNTSDQIVWSTADSDVAVVDENGVLTGMGGGTTTVTVQAPNGIGDERKVTIYEKAKDLLLDPEELTLNEDDFDLITAKVQNAKANGQVTWTVDDPSTAGFFVKNEETGETEIVDKISTKLSGDGSGTSDSYVVIAGIKSGSAVVTAETESETGDMIQKTCQITVKSSDKYVYITQNGARVSGEEMKLDLDGRYIVLGAESSEENDTFTWSTADDSSDPVIKVDSKGAVTLRRKGTAALKVTSDLTGETDICLITVVIRPTGLVLSDDTLELHEGDKATITAELRPVGSEGKVIWSSSDENVATVSDRGEVKAMTEGRATITATPDNYGADSAACEVIVSKKEESRLTVTLSQDKFTYDGKRKVPLVTVKSGDTVLASDITESDENVILMITNEKSTLPGTYTVVAIGRDSKYGSGEAKYSIEVKPTTLKSVKRGRRKFTAKWKRAAKKNVTGYQVRYSLKKSMKKSRTKTVKSWKKSSLTVKKLKGGKKYYVQVRTYVKKNGVMYYSTWSNIKSVKTRK